jgi:hypothetical protein
MKLQLLFEEISLEKMLPIIRKYYVGAEYSYGCIRHISLKDEYLTLEAIQYPHATKTARTLKSIGEEIEEMFNIPCLRIEITIEVSGRIEVCGLRGSRYMTWEAFKQEQKINHRL